MERPDGLSLDGVVIHTDTLPQYSKKKPGYAEGRTLTHELYYLLDLNLQRPLAFIIPHLGGRVQVHFLNLIVQLSK